MIYAKHLDGAGHENLNFCLNWLKYIENDQLESAWSFAIVDLELNINII